MVGRASCKFTQQMLLRCFNGPLKISGKRTFLSDAYRCQDLWNARTSLPIFKDLNMDKLYLAIDKNFQTKGKVLPVDVDIFALGAVSDQQLDDLQDVLHRFRRSPLAADALPSTAHSAVRALLDSGSPERRQRLMDMLDDRINYGLFLDPHTASWLMDAFLRDGNNRDAAKVATQLMLQEDWADPISRALALYSCCAYLEKPEPEPWRPPEPAEDPNADTEFIRVKYLRNEWHDGHFDLREAPQLVGKTLAWLGGSCEEQPAGRSCQLLGWALYGDWERLRRYCKPPQPVCGDVVSRVLELLPAAGDESEQLSGLVSRLPAAPEQLLASLRAAVESAVAAYEPAATAQLRDTYLSWQRRRAEELERQRLAADRQQRLQQLEQRRRQLRERQLLLTFFDNEQRLSAEADRQWGKPPPPKPALVQKLQRRRRPGQDDYVPPSVRREHNT